MRACIIAPLPFGYLKLSPTSFRMDPRPSYTSKHWPHCRTSLSLNPSVFLVSGTSNLDSDDSLTYRSWRKEITRGKAVRISKINTKAELHRGWLACQTGTYWPNLRNRFAPQMAGAVGQLVRKLTFTGTITCYLLERCSILAQEPESRDGALLVVGMY